MPTPGLDLFPSETLFPGAGLPVNGYSQPIQCALNGLVLTATDEFGVDWVQDTLTGWYGSAASSRQSTQKTRAPGGWPGPGQLTPQSLTLAGFVEAPTAGLLADALHRLNSAASLDDVLLTVVEANSVLSMIVRRSDEVQTARVGDTTGVWSVGLTADDPRRFATAVIGSSGLPFVSGGLTIPYTIPYLIDSVVDTGTVSLDNQGNTDGPCVARFDGPLTGPQVTHVQSGGTLAFSSSLILGVDEFLLIDADPSALTALANGQSPRNGLITSRGWPGFLPGVNDYVFGAVSGSGLMTITGTPSWL